MGKRKDAVLPRFLAGTEEDFNLLRKKHKKPKKHKKKHHHHHHHHHRQHQHQPLGGAHAHSPSSEAPESDTGLKAPTQLKLKIKLGGQTLGTKSVPTFTVMPDALLAVSPRMLNVESDEDDEEGAESDEEEPSEGVPIEQYRAWLDEDSNLEASLLPEVRGQGSALGLMDEEERWLEALEKGELDDNGELKKEIDESLLTARQKALLHKQQVQPLLELPMGYKEKELTAEMMQKREERARKRRLQAAVKAEESKNLTIERLTKTSRSRGRSLRERRARPAATPTVRYCSGPRGAELSFPPGVAGPGAAAVAPPPEARVCGVSGCSALRRYACSRSGTPLCSLQCYRKNLLMMTKTTPTGPALSV